MVIMFPAMVMHYKGAASTIDPSKVKIEIPQFELPPLNFNEPPKIAAATNGSHKMTAPDPCSGAVLILDVNQLRR